MASRGLAVITNVSMHWQMDSLVYGRSHGIGKLLKAAVLLPDFPHQPLPLADPNTGPPLDNLTTHYGTVLGACGLPASHVGPGVVLLACQLQRLCL